MSTNTMSSVVKHNLSRIQTFYKDKVVLLTGGTGFLGTVLVEKLLRSCPDIRCIYLLVREKKGMSAEERLNKLVNDSGFSRLKIEQPKFSDKLAVIQGDLMKPKLGLTQNDEALLKQRVDVVFHSAATIKFNEQLKIAVKTNVLPTKEICELAKKITNLKSLVYVSTAFVNSERDSHPEKVIPPVVQPDKLISLVDVLDEHQLDKITPELIHPKPNSYIFTKSAAETVILQYKSSLPVAIIRPSIVGSGAQEPAPGWVNHAQAVTGIVNGVTSGRMHSFISSSQSKMNLVPVDTVANATIAMGYVVANQKWPGPKSDEGLPVVNMVTKSYNCMLWKEFMDLTKKYVYENPSGNLIWYPFFVNPQHHWSSTIYKTLLHHWPAALIDFITEKCGRPTKLRRYYDIIEKYEDALSFFTVREFAFEEKNADVLWNQLDPQDQKLFPFNVGRIDWNEYMRNYVLGCRRYLLKEDDSTLNYSRSKIKVLYVVHLMSKCTLVLIVLKSGWFIFG